MLSLTGRTVTQYSNSTRTWTRTERALAQHRRTSHKRIYRAVHRLAVPRCSRVRYTLRAFFTKSFNATHFYGRSLPRRDSWPRRSSWSI